MDLFVDFLRGTGGRTLIVLLTLAALAWWLRILVKELSKQPQTAAPEGPNTTQRRAAGRSAKASSSRRSGRQRAGNTRRRQRPGQAPASGSQRAAAQRAAAATAPAAATPPSAPSDQAQQGDLFGSDETKAAAMDDIPTTRSERKDEQASDRSIASTIVQKKDAEAPRSDSELVDSIIDRSEESDEAADFFSAFDAAAAAPATADSDETAHDDPSTRIRPAPTHTEAVRRAQRMEDMGMHISIDHQSDTDEAVDEDQTPANNAADTEIDSEAGTEAADTDIDLHAVAEVADTDIDLHAAAEVADTDIAEAPSEPESAATPMQSEIASTEASVSPSSGADHETATADAQDELATQREELSPAQRKRLIELGLIEGEDSAPSEESQVLDDILQRLDAALEEGTEGHATAPAAADGEPADEHDDISTQKQPIGNLPSWARSDTFDEDIDDEDSPKPKQQDLFD